MDNPAWDAQSDYRRPPLVVIVGPTGVGKTELSIQLALRLNGEIVSADSRLFYRGMDIGTAKPGLEERALVAHHLIDVADPDQVWSLAMFQEAATQAIQAIHTSGNLPFLVGGTGQYFRAIVDGWALPKVKPDPKLRSAIEHWAEEITPHGLHNRLQILDPSSAEQIDARNLRRTIRALEVIFTSGKRFSEQRRQQKNVYHTFTLGLIRPRDDLYKRIDIRIEKMIEAGLVSEVQTLLNRGYAADLPTLSAIGYHEIIDHLAGKISLEEAVELMKRRTRIFVRRQANWFKLTDQNIHWYDAQNLSPDQIIQDIRSWLDEYHPPGN
jgi:tRNA dimethylallyltransferase